MLRLLNREQVVPENGDGHNFRYRHQETSHWSVATDYWTWIERVNLHRRANNLAPISAEEAEDQLCQTLPPGWCKQTKEGGTPAVNTRFGWKDVVEGMKSFARVVRTGFVSQAEADRRARICASCYFNVGVEGCGSCHKMATLVTGEVASKKTSYDPRLKACAVCKCALKSLIWFPLNALNPDKRDLVPSFCWQKAI